MTALTTSKKRACCAPKAAPAKPDAQCCAKIARSVAGCHD